MNIRVINTPFDIHCAVDLSWGVFQCVHHFPWQRKIQFSLWYCMAVDTSLYFIKACQFKQGFQQQPVKFQIQIKRSRVRVKRGPKVCCLVQENNSSRFVQVKISLDCFDGDLFFTPVGWPLRRPGIILKMDIKIWIHFFHENTLFVTCSGRDGDVNAHGWNNKFAILYFIVF